MPSQSVFYLAHPAVVRTADQVVSAGSIVSHARHPTRVGGNILAVGEKNPIRPFAWQQEQEGLQLWHATLLLGWARVIGYSPTMLQLWMSDYGGWANQEQYFLLILSSPG